MGARGLIATGVPPQAVWLLWVKVAIIVLSLIVLAMGAWASSIDVVAYTGYGFNTVGTGGGGFSIFIAIWSFIVYGGGLALELFAPRFFYRIGSFIVQILAVIFWLSAWAWSASLAGLWLTAWKGTQGSNGRGGQTDGYKPYKDAGSALGACAGLGAVTWILVIVHLVFFTLACFRDTEAGSHNQAELGQVKQEVPQQQYPQQAYPQQPYPQQPQVQAFPQQPYPAQ